MYFLSSFLGAAQHLEKKTSAKRSTIKSFSPLIYTELQNECIYIFFLVIRRFGFLKFSKRGRFLKFQL